MALSRHAPHFAPVFMKPSVVFSEGTVVFAISSYETYAIFQSNFHESWARVFGSSIKDDLRYTPSDCFETFPFPLNRQEAPKLEAAGKAYFEWRAEWMARNNLGITATYNLFHDKEEEDNVDMEALRVLHRALDQAVLAAYGWGHVLDLEYDYILDYEEEEDESSRRKKPWRYRWTDGVRDQVLGLLLDLNQQRAEEERVEQEKQDAAAQREKAEKEQAKTLKASRYAKAKKKSHDDDQMLPGMG